MSTEITIDTGTSELLCAIRDRVAVITLNRPEVRNAMSDTLTPALRTMIKTCGENPEIGALLITGAGAAFCAGGNVKGMGAHRDKKKLEMSHDEKVADLQERQRLLTGALVAVRKPTIAAVSGYALGGGCELAMMCDIIIASDTAKFGQPEITLGTIPGIGGTQRLTRAVGKSKAMDLCLTGRMMDAAEAERSGLVSRVVPADKLMEEALSAAEKIASMSHPAAAMAKEAINRAFETPLSEGINVERNLFHATFALDDRAEGMAAFIEKRKPVNKNR